LIRKGKIWTAKLRIDHVAIFQASAPRIFNAGASIDSAAAVDLEAVIVSVVGDSGVTASVAAAADSADLVDSAGAAVDSGAAGDN
jgi:hypothetical protein